MTQVPEVSIYIITRKIYKFLRDVQNPNKPHKLHIKRIHGKSGWYYVNDIRIELNQEDDIIAKLIHEVLHHAYPKWSETKVRKHEKYYIKALTSRQVKSIIKKLAEAL